MRLILTLLAVIATYTNPILYADWSDPDPICIDGQYWMTASSFNCVPGLPLLHSNDLVNWTLVNYALPEGSVYWQGALTSPDHGNGVWAPSIRWRDGVFFIFWGDPDRGIFQVHSSDPSGKWSEPVCVIEGKGYIDPCPLFDDDGRVYLVHGWARSRCGFNGVLHACELDAGCTKAISEDVPVFDGNGTGNYTVEGPKFYKKDGMYWIFAPAGGVKEGWQLAMRSESVFGPYEWRKVLEQGSTAVHGPHQGGWVEDAAGNSWFIHFEDRYAWGRVTHLQPMEWDDDGWCLIGDDPDGDGIGQPVDGFELPSAFPTRKYKEAVPFQWQGDPDVKWFRRGRLRFAKKPEGSHNLWSVPALLLRKIEGPDMRYDTTLKLRRRGSRCRTGVVVMGQDYSTVELVRKDDGIYIERRNCISADKGSREEIVFSERAGRKIRVRVSIDEKAICTFEYSADGRTYLQAGEPFKAKEGRWIGARIGTFALLED